MRVNRSLIWYADRTADKKVTRSNGDQDGQQPKRVDRVADRMRGPRVRVEHTRGSSSDTKTTAFWMGIKCPIFIFFSFLPFSLSLSTSLLLSPSLSTVLQRTQNLVTDHRSVHRRRRSPPSAGELRAIKMAPNNRSGPSGFRSAVLFA